MRSFIHACAWSVSAVAIALGACAGHGAGGKTIDPEDCGSMGDLTCCLDTATCDAGTQCVPPGGYDHLCGFCPMDRSECVVDGDCADLGTAMICDHPCGESCEFTQCVRGCSASSGCADGESCDATAHCVATSCGTDIDCPSDFSCDGGTCRRKDCSDGSECEGFCVGGACFPSAGECLPPLA